MHQKEQSDEIVSQVRKILALIQEGRYDAVDLSFIKKNDGQMATQFEEILEALQTTGQQTSIDYLDLPIITRHLTHISETTETGVLNVLNTAETIMGDAARISEKLGDLQKYLDGNEKAKNDIDELATMLDTVQNNCFTILTSLEFDDINKQLMVKIVDRLNQQYEHLQLMLTLLNNDAGLDKKDSAFLDGLKHIIDLDHSSALQSQDMIDEFFTDFD